VSHGTTIRGGKTSPTDTSPKSLSTAQLLPPDPTNEPTRAVSISLITHLTADDAAAALRADAQSGLTATPKSLVHPVPGQAR
jgi:hypothetical protein